MSIRTSNENFANVYLEEGKVYDWLALLGLEDNFYQNLTVSVDKVFYDNENYNNSYITLTFTSTYTYQNRLPNTVSAYCDIDGQVKQQKITDPLTGNWAVCQNNYECSSNVCSDRECVDTLAIAKQLTGFKGFIVKMLCSLTNIGNSDGYNQCIADNSK